MHIGLIVTGAPLAAHLGRLLHALQQAGHRATVCATDSAIAWTGPIPDDVALRGRIRPDAVICCPATFHTLNAWAAGLNNTPALGLLNDAIGLPSPVLAVPMVAQRLAAHPAWARTLHTLADATVDLMDPHTGRITDQPTPIVSGTGETVAEHFDPAWINTWLQNHDEPLSE